MNSNAAKKSLKALSCVFAAFAYALLLTLCLIKQLLMIIFSAFSSKPKSSVVRTPDTLFEGLPDLGYPFSPHYVTLKVKDGVTLPRVHYVDEGPKDATEVILCLHGEPSWSYLYRKMIPVLVAAEYRVVVPDFIGFGKSDKFTSMESYTHDMHTLTLRRLIEDLGLINITLVCQDWGGLTGLAVVKDIPTRFARIVVMNTGLPVRGSVSSNMKRCMDLDLVHRSLSFLIWQASVYLLGTYLPIGFLFHRICGFPKDAVKGYVMPFPSAIYKAGAAKWPLLVLAKPVSLSMAETRAFINTWKKPALVMFSDRDPITHGEEKYFMNAIPHAKKITIHGAGHFLQEESGKELAENIVNFVKSS